MLVLAGALTLPVASAHAANTSTECRARIKAASGLNDKALEATGNRKYLRAADYNQSTGRKIREAKAVCRNGNGAEYVMPLLTAADHGAQKAREHNVKAYREHSRAEANRAMDAEQDARHRLNKAYQHA
ncbi:hypothetical protein [Streptomyces sp. XD-27]|uniref:hypothetical protein n=1 Tax=Streptomyces sp. XD-27 TaxID=3062779 RepID=UPI0026F4471C|nr:hypothetical protein [Streptomyces sp. XD-27]WKX71668.1 hypothetical protein Q3Y56_18690 [Streptomyces sp. XD-27]